ncbi:MAG: Sensor protein QseC [Betaproteobacteria bacterium ADurb.Bin341]|nr:MAG: Sensor protein QseC [Betaproteobacteria bacterium ADurb.Bin341]
MPDSLVHRRSLRKRLMWAFSILTSCALVVQATALYLVNEEQEEDLIDEVVSTALDNIVARPIDQAHVVLGRHLSLYHAPIGTLPSELPESLAKLPIGQHEWFAKDTEFHVGIRDHNGERFYLLYDATEHEERLAWLFWALVAGVVIISLLSLWLGHWFAKVLMRQLEQLAANLVVDDQKLLAQPGQDREVALLAKALDDYRARNAALIAREREFSANVSHELRTPLTRIRTGAELLAAGINDGTRAQRIVLAVDEMERRLKGLLFLARGSVQPEVQSLALRDLVDDLAEHYREDCESRGVTLENKISPEAKVETDRALLSLLVDNLLRNAVKFTDSGSIGIAFEDGCLIVRDTGIGIPEDLQKQVFERHFRGDGTQDGAGLGLDIVREISERCGWRCELLSNSGQGTEVRVRLSS